MHILYKAGGDLWKNLDLDSDLKSSEHPIDLVYIPRNNSSSAGMGDQEPEKPFEQHFFSSRNRSDEDFN